MSRKHILIAEDEQEIARLLEQGLRREGYDTTWASDGKIAALLLRSGAFDLAILDLGLPLRDGFSVLDDARESGETLPIIILTARDGLGDTVKGLEGGANDYMVKPFRMAELLVRVRLRLREHSLRPDEPHDEVVVGDLVLHTRSRQVVVGGGSPVDLTSREFALLDFLALHAGQVMSRDQLHEHVWGHDSAPGSNVVEVLVRALRRKVGAEHITTVRGLGYRLNP